MANFYRIGATDLPWSNVGSWSSTNAGPSNGLAEPTLSDDVRITTSSPATTIVTASAVCNLFVMERTADSFFVLNGANLTINTFVNNSNWSPTFSKTVSEVININNGISLTLAGGIRSTAKIILLGGTWYESGGGEVSADMDINGTVTIGYASYGTGTLTYIGGSVTSTNTLVLRGAGTRNLDVAGISWHSIVFYGGAQTTNLIGDLICVNGCGIGDVVGGNYTLNTSLSKKLIIGNGFNVDRGLNGTATVELQGGTWNSVSSLGELNLPLILNGTITIQTPYYGGTAITNTGLGTITCTGTIVLVNATTKTIDSNGMIWNNVQMFGSTNTIQLSSDMICRNFAVIDTSGGGYSVNGSYSLIIRNGLTTNRGLAGTAPVYLTGGSWTCATSGGYVSNNLYIEPSFANVTVTGNVYYRIGTITYIPSAFSITASSSTLNFQASCTLSTNVMLWGSIRTTGSSTYTVTLASDIYANGNVSCTGTGGLIINGAYDFRCNGISVTQPISGTATIILTGGSWTATASAILYTNLHFAGTVSVIGSVYYQNSTITYISGTVTTTSSTLVITSSCTLNTTGLTDRIVWNNVTASNTSSITITLTSDLTAGGITTILYNTIINKSASGTWTSRGLTVNNPLAGNSKVILTGGSWTCSASTSTVAIDLEFVAATTLSITGIVYFGGGKRITHTSGTISAAGATLRFVSAGSVDTSTMTWGAWKISGDQTVTLISDATVNSIALTTGDGILTLAGSGTKTLNVNGISMNFSDITGPSNINLRLTGGGWSSSGSSYANSGTYTGLTIIVAGNLTLSYPIVSGCKIVYESGSVGTATALWTRGGVTMDTGLLRWPAISHVQITNPAITLLSDLHVNRIYFETAATTHFYNTSVGASIYIHTQLYCGMSGFGTIYGGTAAYRLVDNCQWTNFDTGGRTACNLYLEGNVQLTTNVYVNSGSITYVSGSINSAGRTLGIVGNTVMATNGMTWNAIANSATVIITLTNNLSVDTLFSSASLTFTFNGATGQTVTVRAALTMTAAGAVAGTAKIIMIGGTWSGTGSLQNNLDINPSFAIVTVSGVVVKTGGTITYNSTGATFAVNTSGSTLAVNGASCTLNTFDIVWNNVQCGAFTYTINSLLDIDGSLLLLTGNVTFAGTAGWRADTVSHTGTVAATVTLKEGVTYQIDEQINTFTSRVGSALLFTSAHASTRANLVMVNPSLCNVLAHFTRIDATGGRTINSFGGTITDCVNVRQFYDYQTVAA